MVLSKAGLGNFIFKLVNFDQGFQRADALSDLVSRSEYTSGCMTPEDNRLWFFTNESISYFHSGALSEELQRNTIPVPARLIDTKSGYENISQVGGDTLLVGTADGYLLLALSALPPHQQDGPIRSRSYGRS